MSRSSRSFTVIQSAALFALRLVIGWHFLYEGVAKLYEPEWSSAAYLDLSRWIFSDLFHSIAASPGVLQVVDFLNIWGLILIGLGLVLGFLTRIASLAGIALLLLYYLAHPPLVGLDFGIPSEGHYLVVNKNLVELFALVLLAVFPAGRIFGLDALLRGRSRAPAAAATGTEPETGGETAPAQRGISRRDLLQSLAGVPVLGLFVIALLKKTGWESWEEKVLEEYPDAVTSATIKSYDFASLDELKAPIPKSKIGDMELSRVILGGNLMGGWAHARDLIYVSKLVKAYHHDEKIFETLLLAEKCGINAILTNPILCRVINDYWRRNIGKIQFISDCGGEDLLQRVQMSVDNGASACYVQGGVADLLIEQKNVGLIADALDLIRRNGLPAGIGAHKLETIQVCVDNGLEPDFWMKTLHHTRYWSAQPPEERDNIWCRKPDQTIAYMEALEQPWIAFKTLAAGAIAPREGIKYAFENGADFVCLGMYDFQIVEDVNITLDILNGELERQRPWRA